MKGFIFAAGIGSRLRPWTITHPKALAEVNGRTLLSRVLKDLTKVEKIDSVIINVHHFPEQVKEFLNNNKNEINCPLIISDETRNLLDTGGGLLKGTTENNVREDILVHNVDILSNIDLNEFIEWHKKNNNDVSLIVMERESSRKLLFNEQSVLCGWLNKKTGECIPKNLDLEKKNSKEMAFAGIHILSPKALEKLKAYSKILNNERFSIIDFYLWSMDKLKIKGFAPKSDFKWIDVGKPGSIEEASKMFD